MTIRYIRYCKIKYKVQTNINEITRDVSINKSVAVYKIVNYFNGDKIATN